MSHCAHRRRSHSSRLFSTSMSRVGTLALNCDVDRTSPFDSAKACHCQYISSIGLQGYINTALDPYWRVVHTMVGVSIANE